MIGYVSGETCRAVLLQAGKYMGCQLGSDDAVPLMKGQLSAFFLHSRDVEQVECSGKDELLVMLKEHWVRDRALRLTLIALDPSMSTLAREKCASFADDLLRKDEVRQFVSYRLYANALPSDFPVREVSDFLGALDVQVLEELFDLLVMRQTSVCSCVSAWEGLPDSVFGGADRAEVKARVIKTGAFYDFATTEGGNNNALFKLLADPVLRGRSGTRDIVNQWASKYREKPKSGALEFFRDAHESEQVESYIDGAAAFDIYQQVKKQISQIKKEISANNSDKVDKLVQELVRFQRRWPKEYLSKSLCDLASFAKGLGDIDRSIELVNMAIDEAPSDAWAHIQLGNLLLEKGEFDAALRQFNDGEIYGDSRAALLGRAEALKHLGQMELALKVITECIESFPLDEVAQNGKASILAHFGDLNSALDAYNQIVEFSLSNSIALSGRANVLHDLGQRDLALRDIDIAISLATDDLISQVAKADMLREQNKFAEAMKVVNVEHRVPKWRLQFGAARARILRDVGDWNECQTLLLNLIAEFPRDISLRIAHADLARRMGQFEVAFARLCDIENNFNQARTPRLGMAVTLAALGRIDDALLYLPESDPATRTEWMALHIKGMIELRRENLGQARKLFEKGLDACPWVLQKPHFSSGLALVSLRERKYSEARKVIEETEAKFAPVTKGAVAILREHARVGTSDFSSAILSLSEEEGVLGSLIVKQLRLSPLMGREDVLHLVEWSYLMTLAA